METLNGQVGWDTADCRATDTWRDSAVICSSEVCPKACSMNWLAVQQVASPMPLVWTCEWS